MYYLIASQVLCGAFAAFAAGRKGRSRLGWFAVGLLVPVAGVVMAWCVPPVVSRGQGRAARRAPRRPPRRCTGSYIPDCLGCRYFVRPLFDRSYSGPRKGRCERFDRELVDESESRESRAVSRGGPP